MLLAVKTALKAVGPARFRIRCSPGQYFGLTAAGWLSWARVFTCCGLCSAGLWRLEELH